MNTFVSGKGDVLLAYENEAIQAQQAGADIQFVRPSATILIENPIAVLKGTQNPTRGQGVRRLHPHATRRRTSGPRTATARSCKSVFDKWAKTFPVPKQLFTIRDVVKGGWPVVQPKFFDPNNGVVKQIQST